ncbi:hypothetical protein TIFTF001_039788 [Ficus carica]|uniref:Transposase n=1 Tax=Ficus carica TaxID=3494 RepID=A0AA87YP32_FICCA|nr:hypothetical protein TIFTF001_039788 [Ficus carica]
MEIKTSFTVEPSFRKQALKSCAESAKNFRYDLYQAFVRDHINEENVWQRPPKVVHNYPTITQDDWENFIEYRRTPEFKRLFEQGSKIRKKSKYRSTRGRDGYRKRDQARFEKTEKYAERHTRLDMRVKPDGDFKNEAFKSIADTILTRETRKFRLCGDRRHIDQGIRQCRAFGSSENAEVSDMKRQLAALERTIQKLCTKHGINRQTMAEEATAPTVDQHNSFKVSCTLNEKEAGPSDLKPTPNAIHGIPLGEENVRVTIIVPKLKRALLPIPTNEATCIEEVVGGFVAWPIRLVVVQTSLSQASQGPSHAPDREAEGSKRTKKRAERKKIQSQPKFIIGDDMPIYIGFEDVYHFITFKEISANSIMVYIRYLADCFARTGMDQRFEFISPVPVSPVQQNVDCAAYVRQRAENILRILTNAPKGKLFLMSYNSGQHWILAVIDPWEDSVLYFNPLRNAPGDTLKT